MSKKLLIYYDVKQICQWLRLKVIVRFVDNDGIDDHDCLNFLFTIQKVYDTACPINYQVLTKTIQEVYSTSLYHFIYLTSLNIIAVFIDIGL